MHQGSPPSPLRSLRSNAYHLFAYGFRYPHGDVLAKIASGELATELQQLVSAIFPAVAEQQQWSDLADCTGGGDALAIEYCRLFDAVSPAVLCPLNGGLICGPQMTTMEEVVRFYNHFGLRLSVGTEGPDHISVVLEFLHVLAYCEAQLEKQGRDATAWQLGQRDFIARNPGRWLPVIRDKLVAHQSAPFFVQFAALLDRFLAADLFWLEERHGKASLKQLGHIPVPGAAA